MHDRQKDWKQRTNFEKTEARRKYKAAWIKRKRQNVDTTLEIGDEVTIDLTLYGKLCKVRGRIMPGSTQSQACRYPRNKRTQFDVVRVPFDPNGTLTVHWQHGDVNGIVSLPKSQVFARISG